MANDTNIRGLFPISSPFGNVRIGYYKANTAQAMYRGQAVALNNSGQVQVVDVAANNQALGAIVGFLDSNLSSLPSGITSLSAAAFLPASTDAFVAVSDDPGQHYVVEEDTGGSALTTADIGAGFLLTYQASTGNTTTGYTTQCLDRSTATTGTDGLVQTIGVIDIKNQDGTNNAPGDFCKWRVRIVNHQFNGTKLSVVV